ncbi:hypothetical protein [Rhodoferax sp. GW822-FHT02A01]|uniref:hypothetical protein n=1 Tax=Rhodoferax sp. GW822-FHT02A01 TaxID=3141537 RepID=UPI00315D4914
MKAAVAKIGIRQANDSQLIQYATEIRVRAQRRAGEMLAQTPKATGVRMNGPVVEANDRREAATLADMGITKDQSANWQSLARQSDYLIRLLSNTPETMCLPSSTPERRGVKR